METAVREALRPLLRELRQTLASYHASYGQSVERIYLTGGGARLVGVGEHLAEELALPVEPLPWPEREGAASGPTVDELRPELPVAVGLGLGTAGQAPQVNFRRGEFAYRSDYSFLRAKALRMGVALATVLCFAALNAYASLRGLRKEQELLAGRLKKVTTEVFGAERSDLGSIRDELKAGPKGLGQLPIPSSTAFDLLDDISRVVPPASKIRLDILELEIKPKKTFIKATVETAQQVDDLADVLGKIDCFEEVQKGKVQPVTLPPPPPPPPDAPQGEHRDENRPTELKQFTLTIKGTCP
jgi:general secretion pathway protein L